MATDHPATDAIAHALDQWEERNTAPRVLCENCLHVISRGKRPDIVLINPLDMAVMAKEMGMSRRIDTKSQINGIEITEDLGIARGTAVLVDANRKVLGSIVGLAVR